MSQGQIFLIGVSLTFVAAFSVVLCLRPSLNAVLVDLCGTRDRARFWTVFSTVVLVLMPMIFALEHPPQAGDRWQSVVQASQMLRDALTGLMAAVFGLGFVLSLYIGRSAPPPVSSAPGTGPQTAANGSPAA